MQLILTKNRVDKYLPACRIGQIGGPAFAGENIISDLITDLLTVF
jgi:hypothetical protein